MQLMMVAKTAIILTNITLNARPLRHKMAATD